MHIAPHHGYHMSSYNARLPTVSDCKYLGVTIQSDLEWNKQLRIQQITRKANNSLSMIQRNSTQKLINSLVTIRICC